MEYHILTGDSLAGTFRRTGVDGTAIISRECLIDGPVSDNDPDVFWKKRSEYVTDAFDADAEEYYSNVKSEFDKINNITNKQQNIDTYNNAIREMNAATTKYNTIGKALNESGKKSLENWNKKSDAFLDTHIP